jgi:hypothetical protein
MSAEHFEFKSIASLRLSARRHSSRRSKMLRSACVNFMKRLSIQRLDFNRLGCLIAEPEILNFVCERPLVPWAQWEFGG